jgi:ketosteroid isomerase-like protein
MKIYIDNVRLKVLKSKEVYPATECSGFKCHAPVFEQQEEMEGDLGGGKTRKLGTVYLCKRHHKLYFSGAPEEGNPPQLKLVEDEPLARIEQEMAIIAASDPRTTAQAAADAKQDLSKEAAELAEVLAMVREYVMESEDDVAFAVQSRGEAKEQFDALEERRKKATGPLNQSLREINSWFKPATEAVKAIIEAWNEKLKELRATAEAKRDELAQTAELAYQEGDLAGVRTAMVAASGVQLKPAGIQYQENWCFEVTDVGALPREFMMPNMDAIKAVVKTLQDKTTIAGVRVWNDPIVKSAPRGAL